VQTTTVTLGSLVDSALFEIEHPAERGAPLTISDTDFLENVTDTQFRLKSGALNVSDVVEFGSELMMVTSKSSDLSPIYTVQRGYYRTTPAVHGPGTVGQANPQFPRRRVAEFVGRGLTRMEALGVPLVSAETFNREPGKRHVVLPAEVRQVLSVSYINPDSGRVAQLDGWSEHDNVPLSVAATGKILSLPWYVSDADDLHVVFSEPYSWVGGFPAESATVTVPAPAVDVPSAFAAAMLVSGREVSRMQIDRAEEWAQTEPLRGQGGGALVRAKWQEFYRLLDEARRVVAHDVPVHRPFVRRPRVRLGV
jgi:hypothetical protein